MSFLMIPVTFLHDEYIDRPKLSEQKKHPFEYIVPPPPTSGVGTRIRKKQSNKKISIKVYEKELN